MHFMLNSLLKLGYSVISLLIIAIISLWSGFIFHICWNYLAPKYFGFIPVYDQNVPYWDSVVITYFITLIGSLFFYKNT